MKLFSKPFECARIGVSIALALVLFAGCGLTPEAKEARLLDAGKKDLANKNYARAIVQFQGAARVQRRDAEPYYELGLVYIGMGDYLMAERALRKALELNPKHVQARVKRAELLASLGDPDAIKQGEQEARTVLESAPNNVDALNAVAIAEWKLQDKQSAELDFVKALNQAPQNLQVSLNLAKVKFYQNDRRGAEEILKNAITASPKSAAPVLGLGELYMAEGNAELARQQYQRALQLDPKNDLALVSLASLYVRANQADQAEPIYRQIATLPDPKYKPAHAMFLFQTGKREQAVAEFEKLAKDDPSDRAARTRLIEAYFAVRRLPDAEKLLTAALKKNSRDSDALLQRSRVYLASGNIANAQRDAAQVLHFQSDSAPAHYIMAKIHEDQGQTLPARQELTESLRLDPRMLPVRLELAELLLKTNAAAAALQLMEAKDFPESQQHLLPAIVERNWALWATGNMAELRKGIDQGLSQARVPDLLIQDGLWKLTQRKPAEARVALEEALKLNPADIRGLEALNQTYVVQKQPAMALQKVKEYAKQEPKSAPIQEFLGTLLMANGERSQARAAFTAAKAADPRFEQADLSLVQLDVLEKRWDDARAKLQAILAADSGNTTARLWLGNLEELRGDHNAAIQQLRKVVEATPDNAQASNNLAYLLTEYGNQPDEALKYAEKAVELAPDRPSYCDTLGWALYRKGLYTSAVKYLERAGASRGSVVWKYHLAMAYAKAGDVTHGRTTLEAALRLDPSLPEAKVARQVLAESH